MKRLLAFLLISMASLSIFAEIKITDSKFWSQHELIERKYYKLCYLEELEVPEWVTWTMTKQNLETTLHRDSAPAKFIEDFKVSTLSAKHDDYTNSGYDRGHMANAQDFAFALDAYTDTFYMSNMCPQLHSFNAGIWLRLEEMDKLFTEKYGKCDVACGPIFTNKTRIQRIGKTSRVAVPDAFFRVIYCNGRAYCWIVSQNDFLTGLAPAKVENLLKRIEQLSAYSVDLYTLELSTGLKFQFLD